MIDANTLDTLFRNARTQNGFLEQPVTDAQLHELYDLVKWAPTTMNIQPMRLVFVRTKEGKEKLRPALSPGNLDKTMKAPATAIIAWDSRFYDNLPRTFPHNAGARDIFAAPGKELHAQTSAFRNGSMQGGYFILAARAIGLDCGPMSGFDNAKVDAAFFPDGRCKSNFLCNLGKGDPAKVMQRLYRLTFEEACQLA